MGTYGYLQDVGLLKKCHDFLKFLKEKYFKFSLILSNHIFVIIKLNNFISNQIIMMYLSNFLDLFSV